jgi:NAD+ synthase
MIFLYYYASILDVLVLGTGDKSEMSLGYFTKYGDSAVDLLPIADVYKTEVRSLARYLSIPQEIVDKRTVRVYGKGIQQKAKLELAMRILTRF